MVMKQKKMRLLLGAHMPIAGGLENALLEGAKINCTTIQLFTRSNRQWHTKALTPDAIDLFKKTAQETGIAPIVAHAPYLINLCASTAALRTKSITSLDQDLERCHLLGIPYLVLHPGTAGKTPTEKALDLIVAGINTALEKSTSTTKILLENMAGQGHSLCHTFEHLAYLRKNITEKKRVGVCFDTCHAFAAGYDLRTPEKYEAVWKTFDTIIGLEHLYAIHINDSKKPLGSHVDRHEEIGKGALGLEAFSLLFNDKRFFDIPKILETPKKELTDYARQMETITSLLTDKTRKTLNITD